MAKNLLAKRSEYNRYYGNFRGVDFSNDHTQVDSSRFAYLVNMYKDYKSGQGEAVETIAGFRNRCDLSKTIITNDCNVELGSIPNANSEIYGIHYCEFKDGDTKKTHVLIHCGNKLYKWSNYPNPLGVVQEKTIIVPQATSIELSTIPVYIYNLSSLIDFDCAVIHSLKTNLGNELKGNIFKQENSTTLELYSSEVSKGDTLTLSYYEEVLRADLCLYSSMNTHKSSSFICNNKLYILDGENYLVYDGVNVSLVKNNAYIPTTYTNIAQNVEGYEKGTEHEQRNMLTPKFKNTFVADGETTEFFMSESNLNGVFSIKVYGEEMTLGNGCEANYPLGKITFTSPPQKPEDAGFEKGYAGIEVIASKPYTSLYGERNVIENDLSEVISKCTLCTTYDGKVFVTGNPNYPNHIFYCNLTLGYADASYFGVLNYVQDGVGLSPITGIMCVSDTLMVLKSDTQQDSSIYFHYPQENTGVGKDILPTLYPSTQGLSGLGCLGACCNFLDDPVFLSRLGVEGVSKLKIASERSNEHRSRLIDAKLLNLDISNAMFEEWSGYLCLLVDGKIFMADSRQVYQDSTGIMQYEWYYLEDIGVYDGQYLEYRYSSNLPMGIQEGATVNINGELYLIEINQDMRGLVANEPNSDTEVQTSLVVVRVDDSLRVIRLDYIIKDNHLYLCETNGNHIGGEFQKATILKALDDNLFFGCENGVVCSFNFDLRNDLGEIPNNTYSFNGRAIYCGCATLMDNCNVPHLTKSTVKKSTIIKTKSFKNSSAKIKVRTNKQPYKQIARINSNSFSFDDLEFDNLSFTTNEQSLFAVKEKEKQWVEKQYYLYSDEYLKPFSVYYIGYRYYISGKFKD